MPVLTVDAADILIFHEDQIGFGGITTGHYGTMNEGSMYFASRLFNRPWVIANPNKRRASLVEATQLIDNLSFWGSKNDPDQPMEFPRNSHSIVPVAIRQACYEIALMLLDGFDVEKEVSALTVTGIGFAGKRSTFDRTNVQDHVRNGIPSFKAWLLLTPYLSDPTQVNLVRTG